MEKVFLTYREVSQITGLNRATVSRMVKRGDLPAPIYLGKNPRWHRESFEAWLDGLASDNTQTAA